jgi:hypothetical protein
MPNGDDVQDRLAKRFEGEDDGNEERDKSAMRDMSKENADSDANDGSDLPAGSAWNVENVKQAWKGLTVYLPDEVDSEVDDEWSRLNYVADGDYKKDRHFKPFLVRLGLERMAEMEGEELDERIERMRRMEWVDDE